MQSWVVVIAETQRLDFNPAPLLPFWEKGLGDVELALPEGWATYLKSVRTIAP